MKTKLQSKICSLVILLTIFLASQNIYSQNPGRQAGMADAEKDVSGTAWVAIGCLTGGISWLYGEIWTPAVPQSGLVGQSEEYVASYTDAYIETRKRIWQRNSCIGGAISLGACVIYYVILFSLAAGV